MMQKARRRSPSSLLPVLVTGILAIGGAACGSSEASGEGGDAASSAPTDEAYVKVVNVEAREVAADTFQGRVRLTGAVEALRDVVVSAEEPGVVERFLVEKGSWVRSGQVVARIDDAVLRAQVGEARAVAELARERYERQRQLWEEKRIGSEIAYLQTRYDAESAAARLAALESRLARTRITAPISGLLDERYVDPGEMVSAGTPVVRILEMNRLKIVVGVPERFAREVRKGGRATITFDIFAGRVFEGEISFVGSAVDPRNRTFPIEIVMDNPDLSVKPQMVANVRVATQRLEGVIVVPRDVVLRTEDGHEVFVVTEREGRTVAEARAVMLGPSAANEVVVEKGLEPGDRVIVKGQQLVDPGDRVRIVGGEGGP